VRRRVAADNAVVFMVILGSSDSDVLPVLEEVV
jgi:hypothetical protein